MHHELEVFDDADALAQAAADFVSERARDVAASTGAFSFAVSGGKTPWLMFDKLGHDRVDWASARIFQVDERVAAADSDLRNLKHLRASLADTPARIEAMDVEAPDLAAACSAYAARLPERLDLIHLGLGPDGHCASLVPNDPVLEVSDRLVATSGPYQGALRMTLTYPALARGDQLLWLVSGEDKREALEQLLSGDTSIPAGRVEARASLVMADAAARGAR